MQTIRDITALRRAISTLRGKTGRVALVPTMGALHAGHMHLVHEAARQADHVVVSIFVNPKQFGPKEDFGAYPRQEAADAKLLTEAGVAILWAPPVTEVYPAGFATTVSVDGLDEGLCGAARPGHFDGVATVVAKLFNQVQPDIALFGEKDWQQLAIIRRMTRDLDMPIDIMGVPTQRAADGLALSSRNAYLSDAERAIAPALAAAMRDAIARLRAGADVAASLDAAQQAILDAGFQSVDYVTLVDSDSLQPLTHWRAPARLIAAARLGKTRLIDNFDAS